VGTSTTTVKKHLEALVEVGWLDRVGKAKRGTIKYRIRDDRMNVVLDQVAV
jgi:predicted ArsR family transcriptional regulator